MKTAFWWNYIILLPLWLQLVIGAHQNLSNMFLGIAARKKHPWSEILSEKNFAWYCNENQYSSLFKPKQKMTWMSVVQYEQKKFWRVTKIAIDIYISLLSKFQDQMTKGQLEKKVFAATQEAESRTNGKWHFTLPKSIKRWKLATASSRERLFRRTWKTPSYILLAEGEDHMKEHCVIIELTKITYVHIK